MGPQDSQKGELLPILLGEEEPGGGKRVLAAKASLAGPVNGRKSPQALAGEASGNNHARMVEVLTALGLWEKRQTPLAKLTALEQFAAELIPVLAGEEEIMLVDGQLDIFDPWSLPPILALIEKLREEGRCLVAVTSSARLAEHLGQILVFSGGSPRFAGTVDDLIASDDLSEIIVETDDASTVRALVSPFEVGVRETPEGLVLTAPHGQETAARLLKEGYGSVRMVIVRRPTLEEALLRRI
jgi:ABC-type uncharacterized transport system ATPase subunit